MTPNLTAYLKENELLIHNHLSVFLCISVMLLDKFDRVGIQTE